MWESEKTKKKSKSKSTNNEMEDDRADSIDSGCVPDDSIMDAQVDKAVNWEQVEASINYEYKFAVDLLQHTQLETDLTDSRNEDEEKEDIKNMVGGNLHQYESKANKNIERRTEAETLKELSESLGRLNRGKIGNLSRVEADRLKLKIRKKIRILENKRKKEEIKAKRYLQNGGSIKNNEVYPGIPAKVESVKKIYNQCGKLVFSKFDFSGTSKDMWTEKKKPDLKHALSKVLKEKEKIKSLADAGKFGDAVRRIDNKAWNHALKRMNGEKIKDDLDLINQSMHRIKNQKNKSKKKWNDRKEMMQKAKVAKQDKRKQNIQARKQKNYETKMKKLKKKGRMAPGF